MSYVKQQLKEIRSENGDKKVTNIIEAIENYKEKGGEYSEEEIFGEFGNFFAAGVDTSYHFFAMMVYLIVLHPEV